MIEINNLNFNYRKGKSLFKNLSLSEESGSIVGLLGKNGAGKSTLLKLIAGLLEAPGNPIRIMNEIPIKRRPVLLEEVYYIPEEYDLPAVKINEFINANALFYPRFEKEKLNRILVDFELDSDSNLSKLSYGQRKKFLIGFALSTNCKLLLLDEPTNGLDIPSKSIFRRVVAGSLNEDQLVFISTHQVKDVENLIDKIIVIENGRIVLNKPLWEISETMSFTTVTNLAGANYIYQEAAPGGFRIIKTESGNISEVDIELLFNAAINGVLTDEN